MGPPKANSIAERVVTAASKNKFCRARVAAGRIEGEGLENNGASRGRQIGAQGTRGLPGAVLLAADG
jgi:hypothetical protein